MIFIDSGTEYCPEEFRRVGFYFKALSHTSKHFLVAVVDVIENEKATVAIYETGIPQTSGGKQLIINNGDTICTSESEVVGSIVLYGKYFFPTFINGQQMYYDDSLYGGNQKSDELSAIAEVMNFGIKLGLEMAKIKPY